MTSIADQSVDQLGGAASVLVRQRHDHSRLDGLLEQVQRTTGDQQDEVLTRIWRLVFRHAYAEETVLWPVIRTVLPDGDELTVRIEQEHQEINELAAALDRDTADDDRALLVDRLVELLRQDVRDEEDELLPRLGAAVDAARLRRLGQAWELVRRTAPTRPHPVVSRRPPGNVIAALPLALIDHSRDGLDRAGRRSRGPVRTGARAASRVLAHAAGAVERLAPMRYGERPSTRSGRTAQEPS